MIKLSYCTFGLTELTLPNAIEAVCRAGYPGIELSFHREQFNPFEPKDKDIAALRQQFKALDLTPACVATASYFFTPSRPHEPSLMCPDLAGRKRRIDLVGRGIEVARQLGVPLVSFGSGFIRDDHLANPAADPGGLLVDSIENLLREIGTAEDITLLIEPEPGMYIETLDQALELVEEIDSPNFRLHLDLCHMYCSEQDYIAALGRAAPYARYLHISDAEAGCNLKIILASELNAVNLDFAAYLVYFPERADFLLLHRDHPLYFSDQALDDGQRAKVEAMLRRAGIAEALRWVDYSSLYSGATEYDDEIFTYLISVPRLSFDVLDRARPIIIFLRTTDDSAGGRLMDRRVANTLTGIVHYHEIPGRGTLDFGACFKALNDNGFEGFGSVELYHHISRWEEALSESYHHLSQYV